MAYQWLNSVFARLLVQDCVLCGAPSGQSALCDDCLGELPFNYPACRRCAIRLPRPGICGQCQRQAPPFTAASSLLQWQPPVDYLVHRYKYAARLEIGQLLAELLAEHLMYHIETPPDLLIPTPLHRRRLRARGFNQALEVSRVVAERLDLPLAGEILERQRPTLSQAGLSAKMRRRNIRGAFRVPDQQAARVTARRVAILDDVLTTGSTAAEMSRVLLRAGAKSVEIWTIARSSPS